MDLGLAGKVVVVTGAASGIGQATARLLTEEGAIVVGVDRDQIDTAPGARGTAVQADLTEPATPDRVIATVLEQHGRIDALVNNAGGLQARTSFLDITDEQWLATFNLNFHAARRMSRAVVPAMLASGGGSLVHLGSDSARLPEIGNLDYAAAKLPLLALSTPHVVMVGPPTGGSDLGIIQAALRQAARSVRPPAVATVSAFQAGAWRRIVRVDAVLPPYVPTSAIPWSRAPGAGAVFAGRLSPEKGAAEAIDIARAAGVPIDVYGDAYDAGYSREQIGPRRAWPGVTVHQAVPRTSLWVAMARAAVVLYPVRWDEAFGMAAAEAQACGTPVVAFRRGALSEVIADGVTGFLVPPGDVQAAVDAVGRTAGISRPACRDHAEAHLDLERSLDAHERLYRRLTGPGGAGTDHG